MFYNLREKEALNIILPRAVENDSLQKVQKLDKFSMRRQSQKLQVSQI